MNMLFDPGACIVEQVDLCHTGQVGEVDDWLAGRADATPFHRPAWISAVAKGTRQRALMLVSRDVKGAINGVLPLNIIHSRLFGRALVSSGFAVGGGILADHRRAIDALTDACWAIAQREHCGTVELRGGELPAQGWIIRDEAYLNFAKPMAADDEAQLAAVPKRHRAEIRKGLANGLTFTRGDDAALRAVHYDLYARSVHRLGTPVFPRALFDAVMDAFGAQADIAIASKDGVPVSSVISLYHGDAVMPYWHGADIASRQLRSNEYLYFMLMGDARARGYRVFDFGRSKVGTGPAAWKKSWGFEGDPLSYAVRAAKGEARDVNPLSPKYQRKVEMWKKLPLPVANLIGPMLARGLG